MVARDGLEVESRGLDEFTLIWSTGGGVDSSWLRVSTLSDACRLEGRASWLNSSTVLRFRTDPAWYISAARVAPSHTLFAEGILQKYMNSIQA